MKKLLILAVIAGSFVSLEAKAQERAGSAAIGAVSGAVVLGPIGAVAGALIGFTAGPPIAPFLGVGRFRPRPRVCYIREPRPRQGDLTRVSPPPPPQTPPAAS